MMKQRFLSNVLPIAVIMSFRMLGLFMLIPIFTLYAPQLKGATPTLIGVALGSYGLSQGLLQIPFGLLSDRYGRKPMIAIGLILFALGSLLGALTHSITGMILARIIQGMGAVGSVLIALLADLTPVHQRTLAMGVIGGTIGLAFSVAFLISPIIATYTGLSGIFYLTTLFACIALIMLYTVIQTPKPSVSTTHALETYQQRFISILQHPQLQRLNTGIFCLHFMLTATFFVVPMQLKQAIQNGLLHTTWHFYLPVLILSFLIMLPIIIFAERKQCTKAVFISAISITTLSQIGLAYSSHTWSFFIIVMIAYFIAFNILEAMLPSMISKQADPQQKGTAMGVYSSAQFLGIFVGGSVAGIIYQHIGAFGVFIINAIMGIGWLTLSIQYHCIQHNHKKAHQ